MCKADPLALIARKVESSFIYLTGRGNCKLEDNYMKHSIKGDSSVFIITFDP